MNNQERKSEVIASLIKDGGSATFANVVAVVEQKQLKRGNPLKDAVITKLVSYNMLLNANYQNMVNNQRVRENKDADFVAKENWFTKVNDGFNGSIVAKKSDTTCKYLFFACNNSKTSNYYVNGIEATTEQIETIKAFRPKVAKAVNQDLENDIVVRTIKMEGIKEIKCGEKLIFA
jgi:hypothetical protein